MTLELWRKLLKLASLARVPTKNVSHMLTISFRGLRITSKSKVLWQIACLSLI